MARGYVVKLKGSFGFASCDDGSGDVFLPPRLLAHTGLRVGDPVDFDVAVDAGNGKRFVTRLRMADRAA